MTEASQVSRKEETEYFLSEGFKVETIAELTADEVGEDDGGRTGFIQGTVASEWLVVVV